MMNIYVLTQNERTSKESQETGEALGDRIYIGMQKHLQDIGFP